jgi:hypothetical protein
LQKAGWNVDDPGSIHCRTYQSQQSATGVPATFERLHHRTATIEKRDLIQSPFTIIHPQGIRGVFRPAEIEEILQFMEKLAA